MYDAVEHWPIDFSWPSGSLWLNGGSHWRITSISRNLLLWTMDSRIQFHLPCLLRPFGWFAKWRFPIFRPGSINITITSVAFIFGQSYESSGVSAKTSPPVIKHGWLENPRTEWRFLAGKIPDKSVVPFPARHVSIVTGGYIHEYPSIITYYPSLNTIWLVVWIWIFFPHILGTIIPIDFHIFQRGWYTTNQLWTTRPRITWGRVVIFSNMRLTADNLAHQLKREGMTCRHLHGKLDQELGPGAGCVWWDPVGGFSGVVWCSICLKAMNLLKNMFQVVSSVLWVCEFSTYELVVSNQLMAPTCVWFSILTDSLLICSRDHLKREVTNQIMDVRNESSRKRAIHGWSNLKSLRMPLDLYTSISRSTHRGLARALGMQFSMAIGGKKEWISETFQKLVQDLLGVVFVSGLSGFVECGWWYVDW